MNIKRKAKTIRTKLFGHNSNVGYWFKSSHKSPNRKLIGSVVAETVRISLRKLRTTDGQEIDIYLDKNKAQSLQSFLNSAIEELIEREEVSNDKPKTGKNI